MVAPSPDQEEQFSAKWSNNARCLGSAIKLTFLSYALVRLEGAPYSILKLVIFGQQQMRTFKNGIRVNAPNKSGCVVYRLANFESVIAHGRSPSTRTPPMP